jgi:hypothetical protein
VGCVIERVCHGEYSLIIPNTFNPTHRNFEDISEINIPTLCLYVVRIYFVAFLSLFGHSLRSESVVSLTLGLPKIGRLSRTRSRFILAGTCDSPYYSLSLTNIYNITTTCQASETTFVWDIQLLKATSLLYNTQLRPIAP